MATMAAARTEKTVQSTKRQMTHLLCRRAVDLTFSFDFVASASSLMGL